MPKKLNKKQMVCLEGGMCFWVHNGPVLKSLDELRDTLKNMSDDTFAHHVFGDKNDFAKWADEALRDLALSKKLLKCKTSANMFNVVEKHLKSNYEL